MHFAHAPHTHTQLQFHSIHLIFFSPFFLHFYVFNLDSLTLWYRFGSPQLLYHHHFVVVSRIVHWYMHGTDTHTPENKAVVIFAAVVVVVAVALLARQHCPILCLCVNSCKLCCPKNTTSRIAHFLLSHSNFRNDNQPNSRQWYGDYAIKMATFNLHKMKSWAKCSVRTYTKTH